MTIIAHSVMIGSGKENMRKAGLGLQAASLDASRHVLDRYGNMSSATLMFVLERLMEGPSVENGVALAFGPGVAAEGFRFRSAA